MLPRAVFIRSLVSVADFWWALRDSNPRPAECKCDPFCREVSSIVAFVDIYWVLCCPLSVLSCAVG